MLGLSAPARAMTDEQQAAAVEHALRGDVRCAECGNWTDPVVMVDGFIDNHARVCPPCWIEQAKAHQFSWMKKEWVKGDGPSES